MYMILSSVMMCVGLLLLFLPHNIMQHKIMLRKFSIGFRLFGGALTLFGLGAVFAISSGDIILPLIK
ncbi:hypothetical protein [Sedimentibacter hydroxybenzoicus]|uniref:hypothetical protein n=1 Tax=Sedimentibacter hydroxybenzoicus TaxID=29345 RepID=UPI001C52F7EC|nr:hypothetical protein [Sedimentibacter hydroxybenzoicus]